MSQWRARSVVLALFVAGSLAGCKAKEAAAPPADKPGDLGTATANIAADTATLREAQGAVNEVVRAGDDCDAVKQALPEANRQIDAAAGKVRTPAGRSTLDTLRSQVNAIARSCP
jgi:hypothetical protein